MSKKIKVALGLSGGVDSAVSAYLLKQQGYDITAVYLECWNMPGCRAEQDRQDALKVALQLQIPFQVLDFKQEYKEKVMSYFVDEYRAGRTPNPDVLCNQVIKFGLFYDWAMKNDFTHIATGHYAQTDNLQIKNKAMPALLSAKDLHKDQTYFLHQIKQQQLEHILFPVGHLLKKEVRDLAHKNNLHVADKRDSVGICFVGDINVHEFLKEKLGENSGEVVTVNGDKVGTHFGLWFYTIGQRKGFTINTNKIKEKTNWIDKSGNLPSLYVIKKIPERNQLVVGPKPQTETKKFTINKLYKINPKINWDKLKIKVRIRHTGKLVDCLIKNKGKKIAVVTKQSLQGIASGQFAVFYTQATQLDQDQKAKYICLGGGTII